MKKTIPISLIMLLTLFSVFAQQPPTAYFNGKLYMVFPYKIKADDVNSDESAILQIYENTDAPWFPGTLPDGDYIAYYSLPYYYHYDDTTCTAITFSIKNNKKEGPATFYAYNNKNYAYLSGNYSNDLKEGTWKYTPVLSKKKLSRSKLKNLLYYFPEPSAMYGFEIRDNNLLYFHGVKTFTYSAGVLSGPYSISDPANKLLLTGEFLNLKPHGTWTMRYKNKIYSSVTYKEGLKDGAFSCHPDEENYLKGSFTSDAPSGIWEYYDTKQRLKERHTVSMPDPNVNDKDSGKYYSMNYKFFRLYGNNGNERNAIVEYIDDKGNTYQTEVIYKGRTRIKTYRQTDKKGTIISEYKLLQSHPVLGNIYENTDYLSTGTLYWRAVYNCIDYREHELLTEYYNYDGSVSSKSVSTNWYVYNNQTLPELILTDSSVSNTLVSKKKYTTTVTDRYLHTSTNRKFTRSRTMDDNGKILSSYDFDLHIEKDRLVENRRIQMGKLMIRDTIQYLLAYDSSDGEYYHHSLNDDMPKPDECNIYTFSGYNNYDMGPIYSSPDRQDGQVFWDNTPYNGPLYIYYHKLDTDEEPRVEYKIEREILTGIEIGHSVNIYLAHNFLDHGYYSLEYTDWNKRKRKRIEKTMIESVKSFVPVSREFHFSEGKWDGLATFKNGSRDLLYETSYTMGFKHGRETTTHPIYSSNSTYQETRHYAKGVLHGTNIYKYPGTGEVLSVLSHSEGVLDGRCLYFDDQQKLMVQAEYKNDSLDGLMYMYADGYPAGLFSFRKSILDGHSYSYYTDYNYGNAMMVSLSPEDNNISAFTEPKTVKILDVNFKNGILCDTGYYYFNEGNIKAMVLYHLSDSIRPLHFVKLSPQNGKYIYENNDYEYFEGYDNYIYYSNGYIIFQPFSLDPELPGQYTYYFKSGVRSQQGAVKNGQKTGWWQYWNESGNLMKEIEYSKGLIIDPVNGKDTIYYTGKIKLYYPTGAIMAEGYVTDATLSYECVQDADVSYEDVYYTAFFDRDGKSIFNHYSGQVQDFHLNGNKRIEGQIENGKREKTWKYFDPDGNLRAIGNYINGKKDGRWLIGDLSGINYLDNQCYNNDQMFELQKLLRSKELSFTETLWKDGVMIKEVSYELIKN